MMLWTRWTRIRLQSDVFEAGHIESVVQHASGWLDKRRVKEKDEFEANQKKLQVTGRAADVAKKIDNDGGTFPSADHSREKAYCLVIAW